MCDPVSIGLGIGSLVLSQALKPSMPKTPDIPAVKPVPEAQADKAPTYDALKANRTNTARGSGFSTADSTLLTGPAGVDPNALNLGKSVLLGN